MTPANTKTNWHEILNRKYAGSLLLICLGVWLHAADGLIVATMMPAIVTDIGGEAYVAWTVALYGVGSIIAGVASALTVLRLGIRAPMVIAASIFALGCLISALAPNMQILISGRLFQGLGGGALTAISYIAIARLFPTRLAARAMAVTSILWGASAFLGPMIGGFFTTYSTWRWGFVFFGVQALILAAWILLKVKVTEKSTESGEGIPFGRLTLLTSSILLIAYAGIKVNLTQTPMLLMSGFGILVVFLLIDARNSNRLLPKLRTRVGAALAMTFAIDMAVMGLGTYGPLLMAEIHGTSPIVAGYVLACVAIGWTFSAIFVSGAPEHHDPFYIASGTILVVLSIAGMIYAVAHGPIELIAALAVVEGIGFGISWTFVIRRAKSLADPEDVERLSGALPTVGRLGNAIGASICGILANAAGFSIDGTVAEAAHVSRTIFTGLLPLGLLSLLAMVGRW